MGTPTNAGVLKATGLKKVMLMGYMEELEVLRDCVNSSSSSKAYEDWTGVVAPGVAEEKTKGDDMAVKEIFVETPKRVTHRTFAVAIRMPFEDQDDDLYGPFKRLAEMVGRSHKVVREVMRAHLLLNSAFSTWFRTGYDGLALCSTAHLLQGDETAYSPAESSITTEPSRSATTWSNRLATDSDLSYQTIIDLVTLLRRTVTREGDFASLMPSKLIVAPENEHVAFELTKSRERPDTANRAVSSVNRHGITVVSTPYNLDTDSMVMHADRHDLQEFVRMDLKTKVRDVQGSWDVMVESAQRLGYGFHDPRGVVGTPGA